MKIAIPTLPHKKVAIESVNKVGWYAVTPDGYVHAGPFRSKQAVPAEDRKLDGLSLQLIEITKDDLVSMSSGSMTPGMRRAFTDQLVSRSSAHDELKIDGDLICTRLGCELTSSQVRPSLNEYVITFAKQIQANDLMQCVRRLRRAFGPRYISMIPFNTDERPLGCFVISLTHPGSEYVTSAVRERITIK